MGRRRAPVVIAGALALHAALLVVLDHTTVRWRLDARPVAPGAGDAALAEVPTPAPPSIDIDVLALLEPSEMPPPLAVWGPGDLAGFSATHPLPNADVDRPGDRAAERGGGATGGPTVWADRRDRLDDATLLAEPWNGGDDYRAAHDRSGARTASAEALHRRRDPAAGDRQVQRLAADGGEVASTGAAAGIGAGDGDAVWRDADPRFGLKPGQAQAMRRGGATQLTRDPALADRGAPSADVTTRGDRTGDDETVAAASRETTPDPFDLTPAQSGGADRGVAGAPGAGAVRDGRRRGGEGATRADATPGARDLAIKARPQDPYFRELFTRIEREIRFPRDLAIDLRSGRSIAVFVLAADGGVSDIRLHATSGYQGFDDELLRVVRSLRELEPVPARLLDGRTELHVLVPFEFRAPMVR